MILGARQFFERRGAPTPPLPYDAEVEYLECSGLQYIDTGVRVSSSLGIEIMVQYASSSGAHSWMFGGRTGYANASFGMDRVNSNNFLVWYGSTSYAEYKAPQTSANTCSLMQNVYRWNGTTHNTFGAQTFSSNSPLYIGTLSIDQQGTPSTVGFVGKMYWFKVFQGSTLVRDCISVRFTNELGQSEGAMYDRISGQLFRNQGTGAFTIGPDKS